MTQNHSNEDLIYPKLANELITSHIKPLAVVTVGPIPDVEDIFHAYTHFTIEDLRAPIPELTKNFQETYEKESEGRAMWMDHPDWVERAWQEGFAEDHGYKTDMQLAFFYAKTNGSGNIRFELTEEELHSPDLRKWRNFGGFCFTLVRSYKRLELNGEELTFVGFDGHTVPMRQVMEDPVNTEFCQFFIVVDNVAVDGEALEHVVRERNGKIFIIVKQYHWKSSVSDKDAQCLIRQIREAKEHPDMFAIKRAMLQIELLN